MTFFRNAANNFHQDKQDHHECSIGKIWQPADVVVSSAGSPNANGVTAAAAAASAANDEDKTIIIRSLRNAGEPVRLCFRNLSHRPLLLCWVDPNGTPHHFYRLNPSDIVQGPVTCDDKVENSRVGHAFLLASCGGGGCSSGANDGNDSDSALQHAQRTKSLETATVLGGYRPSVVYSKQEKDREEEEKEKKKKKNEKDKDKSTTSSSSSSSSTTKYKYPIHLICIEQRPIQRRGLFSSCFAPCGGSPASKRQHHSYLRKKRDDDGTTSTKNKNKPWCGLLVNDCDDDDDGDDDGLEWYISVTQGELDPTPCDSTNKVYERTTMGGGWTVRLEKDWHAGDMELKSQLEQDLAAAAACIPDHAVAALRAAKTEFWINKTLRYGPKVSPVHGRGLCFHPDADWLIENGCHPEKVRCVELYDAGGYKESRLLWGTGGVIIHELSHAYHNTVLPDGYDNADIKECYEHAMKEKLYDCVAVHGTQGPTAKAYACDNCMEYFAELSTAFLGGTGPKSSDEEFNKWYPFNRKQIQQHDPRAYEMLKRVWKVE